MDATKDVAAIAGMELAGRYMQAAKNCAENNPQAARTTVRHALVALGLIGAVKYGSAQCSGEYNCIPLNEDPLDRAMKW